MRRLNCIAPLRQYDEDEAAGLVANLKPAPLGRRVRSDGFFYGLPFK
ncbi:MAG: hypothetical protein ISN26_03320 [Betaproteobacteria bacterium AqS2]|uniref:Uncharacterized protein n=1 Tax=Candidatus Amphirhobacter heronislandensis TaxID=1732024 RepID=A0A930UET2_9GAMM|nr:hypothetical protein [Betaproteobacteria bacterium AqS2]